MKLKKIISIILIFSLLVCLAGCSDSGRKKKKSSRDSDETTQTDDKNPEDDKNVKDQEDKKEGQPSDPQQSETQQSDKKASDENPDSTAPEDPDTQQPVHEEVLVKSYDMSTDENMFVSEMNHGFSEGRAWTVLSDNEFYTLALIDTDGKIVYKTTTDGFAQMIGVNKNDCFVRSTYFESGYTVLYNTKDEGFIIIDKDGQVTYNTRDFDDNTFYYFLGQYKDSFICFKEEKSFSSMTTKMNVIDCKGNIIKEDIAPGIGRSDFGICHNIGEGFMYGDYSLINCNNWNFINGSYKNFTNPLVSIDDNDGFVDGYLIINMSDLVGVHSYVAAAPADLKDQKSYNAFCANAEKKGGIRKDTFGEGKYLDSLDSDHPSSYVYKTIDGKTAVTPQIPDTVTIETIGTPTTKFSGGYAMLKMRGADGEYYISSIDSAGKLQFEPKKTKDVYEHTGNYEKGYLPCAPTHSSYFSSVLTYDGRVLKIGEDDLSELKDITLTYRDNDWPVLKGGFFCGYQLENEKYGFKSGKKVDYYVSLDGKKVITKAFEYSVPQPESFKADSLLYVKNNIFYMENSLLGKSYAELNTLFGNDLPELSDWEWSEEFDGYFDYNYHGNLFGFFFKDNALRGVSYEFAAKNIGEALMESYKAEFGAYAMRTYSDGTEIPEGNGWGYRFALKQGYLDIYKNHYNNIDHVVIMYCQE